MATKERFLRYIHALQDEICAAIEVLDGASRFREDQWERPGGGGGRSRIMQGGPVIEKGGVSVSAVHGSMPEALKEKMKAQGEQFFACGLSLVLHPRNPMAPTVHANFRYFEMYDAEGKQIDGWFGGGADLTPYYLFDDDARHFHRIFKEAADRHHPDYYPRFKRQCDEYFYNHHRSEARGIGGLFFDYLRGEDASKQAHYEAFTKDMGKAFLPAYLPLLKERKDLPYTEEHRYWQEIRRGRYVEFNLVHDRGTLFGLKTQGRTESILMSLPPRVRWEYDHQPESGSAEAALLEVLRQPKNWLD